MRGESVFDVHPFNNFYGKFFEEHCSTYPPKNLCVTRKNVPNAQFITPDFSMIVQCKVAMTKKL
jgi:hypothetical protein